MVMKMHVAVMMRISCNAPRTLVVLMVIISVKKKYDYKYSPISSIITLHVAVTPNISFRYFHV